MSLNEAPPLKIGNSSHRQDIDGLRAIAVLSVVFFHCGFIRFFPGGFVGVDVFFVISGFLITGILRRDLENNKYSLVDFYNRRIRRVFPALYMMYAFVMAASIFTLMPGEIKSASENVISSIFFVSNAFFYTQDGYFNQGNELNATLHTWSLSVEEQFYVFLPPFLYLIRSWPAARCKALISAIAGISFCVSVYMVSADRSAAFYLVQYRIWELLIGSLLAIKIVPPLSNKAVANLVALGGLCLIIGSVLFLSSRTPFPGAAALPACLGTALLLYSGENFQTLIGRALAFSPVRFIGLVSYSFYLWHWPIWVLGRQLHEPAGPRDRIAFILVSFGISVLSWRFIEQPFRGKPYRISPRRTLILAGGVMAASLVVVSIAAPLSQRLWNISPQIEQIANYTKEYNPSPDYRNDICFLTSASNSVAFFKQDPCLDISATKPNYLLIGDSHAAQFYGGLLHNRSYNILQATASGCKPIIGSEGQSRCTDLMGYIFDKFLPNHHVNAIIFAARWEQADIPGLLKAIAIAKLYSDKVIVFGPIVEYDIALPRIIAKSIYYHDESLLERHRRKDTPTIDDDMRVALGSSGAEYISIYKAMCPKDHCVIWDANGKPVQFDYGHLTAAGAETVISIISTRVFGGPAKSSKEGRAASKPVATRG